MVTSGQITQSVMSTMQAMDRAARRAERQRAARQSALNRQALLDASARAAAEHEAIVEALTCSHRITFRRREWLTNATGAETARPERLSNGETYAQAVLDDYAPSWFARILGRERRQRQALADEVAAARASDDEAHARAVAAWAERNDAIAFARRVVAHEPDALAKALETHSAIGSLPFSVEGARILFRDGRVIIVVDGLDLEDMPEQTVTLLKSGKASVKAMSSSKRLEMHRDAICSAAVRVGLECLATLPLDEIEVLMLTDVLDRATGHIASLPVLHLRVSAQAIGEFNLARTDAAALVDRLGAHQDWRKREGFRPISAAAFGIDL